MKDRSPIHIRAARIGAGALLLLVGIAGLFLPILPGWLLIFPGLALLGREFAWAERLLDSIKARFEAARASITASRDVPIDERDAA